MDNGSGKAPLKPHALYKQNLAKKPILGSRNCRVCGERRSGVKKDAFASWHQQHNRKVLVQHWVQRGFGARNGLIQGCPLSVLLCAVWGALWVHQTHNLFVTEGPGIGRALALGTLMTSALLSRKLEFERSMGMTAMFFRAWRVGLNLQKSTLLQNEMADSEKRVATVLTSRNDAHLLGVAAGIIVEERLFDARTAKASARLERIRMLPLTQRRKMRLIQVFATPMTYGCELNSYSKAAWTYDRKAKDMVWGTARVSSNGSHQHEKGP